MNEIKINPENAIKAYNQASGELKETLGVLFGETVVNQNITDRVTSFETACEELGINMGKALPYDPKYILSSDQLAINSFAMMQIITRALNGRDLTDDETHYYPYFNRSSGFGLSCSGCGYTYARASVGSRLSFHSPELAIYAGQTFVKIYQNFMTTVQGNPTGKTNK